MFMNSWNDKLTQLFKVNRILRENYLRPKRIWKSKNGKGGIQNLLSMSRNENWNLKDYNCDKPVNDLIKLKEKELACVVNWS